MKTHHPIQPLQADAKGVIRFKKNEIVSQLLDFASKHGMDLNKIACMDFDKEDRQQFAQLIGYSLSGYGELQGYVDDDAYGAAQRMWEDGLTPDKARIAHLEGELKAIRESLVDPMARLFGKHPDDLKENI